MAAHRGGIKRVLVPQANKKDLTDIPQTIKDQMEIIPVMHMDDLLPLSLLSMPIAAEGWKNQRQILIYPTTVGTDKSAGAVIPSLLQSDSIIH